MDETKENIAKGIVFVIIIVLYMFIRKDSGFYEISKGWVEVGGFLSLVCAGQYAIWRSRYYMQHITVNGFSGSFWERPYVLSDDNGVKWAVFQCGANKYPVPMEGKLATLVLPFSHLTQAGRNIIAPTLVTPRALGSHHIPSVVYTFLQRNKSSFNTELIYFGKHTEGFVFDEKITIGNLKMSLSSYEEYVEHLHAEINRRDDLLEGRNDAYIEQYELAKKLTTPKKSVLDVFKPKNPEVQQ